MKKTNFCKKFTTLACIACLGMAAFLSPIATLAVRAATPDIIQPYSDDIRWRFKEENGKLYRRLYNYTKDRWESPTWEYVRDL